MRPDATSQPARKGSFQFAGSLRKRRSRGLSPRGFDEKAKPLSDRGWQAEVLPLLEVEVDWIGRDAVEGHLQGCQSLARD